MWGGHPPSLKILRTFGCVAYAHIRQGKLERRALKCMFLGYPDTLGIKDSWNSRTRRASKHTIEEEGEILIDDDVIYIGIFILIFYNNRICPFLPKWNIKVNENIRAVKHDSAASSSGTSSFQT